MLTGQFVGFQSALCVESADYKIICESAGTGAEAGGHFETGPVLPFFLQGSILKRPREALSFSHHSCCVTVKISTDSELNCSSANSHDKQTSTQNFSK